MAKGTTTNDKATPEKASGADTAAATDDASNANNSGATTAPDSASAEPGEPVTADTTGGTEDSGTSGDASQSNLEGMSERIAELEGELANATDAGMKLGEEFHSLQNAHQDLSREHDAAKIDRSNAIERVTELEAKLKEADSGGTAEALEQAVARVEELEAKLDMDDEEFDATVEMARVNTKSLRLENALVKAGHSVDQLQEDLEQLETRCIAAEKNLQAEVANHTSTRESLRALRLKLDEVSAM